MKRKIILIGTALLMGFTFMMYSCDDDDDNGGNNNTDPATCNDGIQNQGETGVDCGGPCLKCEYMAATIDGNSWEADQESVQGRLLGAEIYIQGSNDASSSNIRLVYEGIWNPGTYELKRAAYNIQSHSYVLTEPANSEIVFSSFTVDAPNKQDSTMTGTFNMTLVDTLASPMDTVEITNGSFTDIYFNN